MGINEFLSPVGFSKLQTSRHAGSRAVIMYAEEPSNILTVLSCHQSNQNTLLQVLNISLVPQVWRKGGANDVKNQSKS